MSELSVEDLLANSQVTAYVDILGWGAITQDGVNDILRREAFARERGTASVLSDEERQRLLRYAERILITRKIDATIQEILARLRRWMVPEPLVGRSVSRRSRNFWENRHATFVRVSDGIFVHSTSFSTIAYVVSELLKRGLASGVMLRAGLSLGYVEHSDHPSTVLDSRPPDLPPTRNVRSQGLS